MTDITEILKADKEKKLIIGFRESLRAVKLGHAHEVFATKTCPNKMKTQLKEAADLSDAKLTVLEQTSEELTAQLKKSFTITVAAISSK